MLPARQLQSDFAQLFFEVANVQTRLRQMLERGELPDGLGLPDKVQNMIIHNDRNLAEINDAIGTLNTVVSDE